MKTMNNYDRKIPKYNVTTYNGYTYSSIPINYSKHISYCISSEDEKTNTRTNNFLIDKYKSNGTKKLNNNAFSNSHKFFYEYQHSKENNKSSNLDNSSRLSNHAFISLNSFIEEKNQKLILNNNNGNSIKNDLDKKNIVKYDLFHLIIIFYFLYANIIKISCLIIII